MRNVSKKVAEKIKTQCSQSITLFPKKHAVIGTMWTNMMDPDRPEMI